ncbi:hypothetical protein AALO_G00005960 [Alosa alosa]|uniref:Uncharacterized protein n=1 Tax=Alosa alosa TaxID=278164 RepID=A0AAV6HI80_9TELE|nr:hypothetical protein AALO_G00005960 [Alosa alosa]
MMCNWTVSAKKRLKNDIKEYIKAEGDDQVPPTADADTGLEESDATVTESPPEKQPRLFSHYRKTLPSAEKPSVQPKLTGYLHLITEENITSISSQYLKFWQQNKYKFGVDRRWHTRNFFSYLLNNHLT